MLQSTGSQRVIHDWTTEQQDSLCRIWDCCYLQVHELLTIIPGKRDVPASFKHLQNCLCCLREKDQKSSDWICRVIAFNSLQVRTFYLLGLAKNREATLHSEILLVMKLVSVESRQPLVEMFQKGFAHLVRPSLQFCCSSVLWLLAWEWESTVALAGGCLVTEVLNASRENASWPQGMA